jgi:hypothetical protein
VDTSKYIWSREGGTARPLPVKWGQLGATSAAGHLESSTTIEGVMPPGAGAEVGAGSINAGEADGGCCSGCCAAITACFAATAACAVGAYAACARMRPTRN